MANNTYIKYYIIKIKCKIIRIHDYCSYRVTYTLCPCNVDEFIPIPIRFEFTSKLFFFWLIPSKNIVHDSLVVGLTCRRFCEIIN